MRIHDFCQPGRTIGTGELSQTRDMLTVQATLPGGVQINSFDVTILGPKSVRFAWDYHPGQFIATVVAPEGMKRDAGYISALQRHLDKIAAKIVADNGRLGESCEYKLKSLPEGKTVSRLEGFINPHTFAPPQDSDPCMVKKLNFSPIDNTSAAALISVYLLVERELTTSVRRNRFRTAEITSPDVESLPIGMIPEMQRLFDANAPASPMSVDGGTNRRPADNAQQQGRRTSPRSGTARSPGAAASAAAADAANQQQELNVIPPGDTSRSPRGTNVPSLADIMRGLANPGNTFHDART